ncbi:MAG: HEAT repeat domain-containing protein [Lentisphaeria bacterium]|nr:HEAT repeat domain-containing protein [Lentisphaeria bacterium]
MKNRLCIAMLLCCVICSADSAETLVAPLLRDLAAPVARVRAHAARRLGEIRAKQALPSLVKALDDGDAEVRRQAVRALAEIRDARASAPLCRALVDESAQVRFAAAHALGELKEPRTGGALLKAFCDPVYAVRNQAAWALREIGGEDVLASVAPLLDDETADFEHVVWLVQHLAGDKAPSHFAILLTSRRVARRLDGVRILRGIGSLSATKCLISAVGDASLEVRKAVVEALLAGRHEIALAPLRVRLAVEPDPALKTRIKEGILQLILHPSIIGHWSFDDDGGVEIAKDVTGRGDDGEIKGCTRAPGKVGQALAFGPGKYVELGKAPSMSMAGLPITLMAWINSDADDGVVVARGGGFSGFSLYLMKGLPKFGIHLKKEGPAYIAVGTEPVLGRWVHLAGVVRKTSVEIYVDGKLVGTTKTPGYLLNNAGQGMEIGFDTANSPCEIVTNFTGLIDEVKMFQTSLSAAEIVVQMKPEKPEKPGEAGKAGKAGK